MNSKALMFLAAGNVPAALYEDRKSRRARAHSVEGETKTWLETFYDKDDPAYKNCHLGPLKTFIPTHVKLNEILRWLKAANMSELSTCKIGLATAGEGLVAWSYRTRIERTDDDGIVFTGRFKGLPCVSFSKLVITMANGDEFARKMLSTPIKITSDIDMVTSIYTLRIT